MLLCDCLDPFPLSWGVWPSLHARLGEPLAGARGTLLSAALYSFLWFRMPDLLQEDCIKLLDGLAKLLALLHLGRLLILLGQQAVLLQWPGPWDT